MKTLLSLLLVAALGGLYWVHQNAKQNTSAALVAIEASEKKAAEHQRAASVAEMNLATLRDESEARIARLTEQLAVVGLNANEALSDAEASILAAQQEAARIASESNDAAAIAARTEDIDRIYHAKKAELAITESEVVEKLAIAQRRIDQIKDSPPEFSEQNIRTNSSGITGVAGIRTSAADRAEAMEKYQDELDLATADLAKGEGELVLIRSTVKNLEDQYRAALARAKLAP